MKMEQKMELTPAQFEINRLLEHLDETATAFEAVWGCDRLPLLVPAELKVKWDRQIARLNDAIQSCDLALCRELVNGTIRGYAALESAAIAAGHTPIAPECWEVKHPESGRVYRICKNLPDSRTKAAEGVVTYSLVEVARILEARQLVNMAKETVVCDGSKKLDKKFDFKKGDVMPF